MARNVGLIPSPVNAFAGEIENGDRGWTASRAAAKLNGEAREARVMEWNLNYWGFLAVGVSVVLCFGPALVVWLKAEREEKRSGASEVRNPK